MSSAGRSATARIENTAKERGLSRDDAFTAYAMDRLLFRLGRSRHAADFALKGGVLVAEIIDAQHRFTRDIDLLRSRRGPPDENAMRKIFRDVVAVTAADAVIFAKKNVRATAATRASDGYDGVTLRIGAMVDRTPVDVKIDIGFGDAVLPPSVRRNLTPFLQGDPFAQVMAYPTSVVVAEKVQTLLERFPLIEHRLKDLLDVVVMLRREALGDAELARSMQATFKRRGTTVDLATLEDMCGEVKGKRWETHWATMKKEKLVADAPSLPDAVQDFAGRLRPVLKTLS